MIRAIESRDLIMDEFSPDFFNPKSVKMTDLLREGAGIQINQIFNIDIDIAIF